MTKEELELQLDQLSENALSNPSAVEREVIKLMKIARSNEWLSEYAYALQILAYSYYQQGRTTEAIEKAQLSLDIAKVSGNELRKFYCVNALAVVQTTGGSLDAARELLLEHINEARQIAPPSLLSTILHNLVYCLDFSNDERSYQYLAELISLLPKIKDHEIINGVYDTICYDLTRIEDYEGALKAAEDWRKNAPDVDLNWRLQQHICFGSIFLKLRRMEEAEKEFNYCLRIAQEHNFSRYIVKSLLYLAQLRIETDSWKEAEILLKEVLPLSVADKFVFLQVKEFMARCLAHKGFHKEAIGEFNEILKDESQGFSHILPEIFMDLANSYSAIGDFKEAFDNIKKSKEQIDTKYDRNRKGQVGTARITLAIESEKHDREMAELKLHQAEQELANYAILLASQSELLGNFRNDLRQIVREINEPIEALKKIKERLKTLPCEEIDWLKFESQFTSVHPEFKRKLLEKFPELTPQETRVCLLLRVGMKSYEVGRIICVSERGVENHRFNIRKKLALKTEQSLTEFLQGMK